MTPRSWTSGRDHHRLRSDRYLTAFYFRQRSMECRLAVLLPTALDPAIYHEYPQPNFGLFATNERTCVLCKRSKDDVAWNALPQSNMVYPSFHRHRPRRRRLCRVHHLDADSQPTAILPPYQRSFADWIRSLTHKAKDGVLKLSNRDLACS